MFIETFFRYYEPFYFVISLSQTIFQHDKALISVQRDVANLMYRYLCTSTTMHYSKTGEQADNSQIKEESSTIMKLSEGMDDLWYVYFFFFENLPNRNDHIIFAVLLIRRSCY